MVRLVHLRTAGRSVRRTNLPQPLTVRVPHRGAATYAIGFVVRPFSGIIISPLADRYGRRVTLTLSISGMALGSLLIALTPGYNTNV